MKKEYLLVVLVCLLLLGLPLSTAAAQEGNQLQLSLVRNFGYGGFGKIQGDFTLKVASPPPGLAQVAFYLDDELLGRVEEPPFQVKFHTAEFEPGEHQFSAVGILEDGSQIRSGSFSKIFLSSAEAWSDTKGIVIPLLVGTGVLTLIGLGVPLLTSRKKEFQLGVYGPAGGAVCPRCGLPFSRSVLAPNMMVGKLVRCPHCSKISIRPRAGADQLERAERRYSGAENPPAAGARGEDLHKALDDSRFEN